jgi:hypothetical protein
MIAAGAISSDSHTDAIETGEAENGPRSSPLVLAKFRPLATNRIASIALTEDYLKLGMRTCWSRIGAPRPLPALALAANTTYLTKVLTIPRGTLRCPETRVGR